MKGSAGREDEEEEGLEVELSLKRKVETTWVKVGWKEAGENGDQ